MPEILVRGELRKLLLLHSLSIKRFGRKLELRMSTRVIECLNVQTVVTDITSKLIFIQQIFIKNFHEPHSFF